MSIEEEYARKPEDEITKSQAVQPERGFSSIWSALTLPRVKRRALLYWAVLLTASATIMHLVAVLHYPPSILLTALLIGFTLIQAVVASASVLAPGRRLLLLAGALEAGGLLIWLVAHVFGLPDGFSVWRAETLGVMDLYIPLVEGISAVFFLCLGGRAWTSAPRMWRIIFKWFPLAFLLALLVWLVLKSVAAVAFFLVPGALSSVQIFFLPVVIILAVFLIVRACLKPLRAKTPHAWRTTFTLLPALLILGILTWGGGVSAIDTAWLSTSATVNVPAGQMATLAYCQSANGSPMAMDISEPSAQMPRPAPMVVYIHGGETLVGSRVMTGSDPEVMYLNQLRTDLLNRGFIVGSIDYGLVPLDSAADQARAAKCAVRFLRAHASELGLDPQRIGVMGDSQGGYISAMLGTVGPEGGYDMGQYLDQSSSVQAVVDMWGPTDLANLSGSPSCLAGASLAAWRLS